MPLSDDGKATTKEYVANATLMKNKLYEMQRTNPLISESCGKMRCGWQGTREANLRAHRFCLANLGGGSSKNA